MSHTGATEMDVGGRVNQVYRDYLTSLFRLEYFRVRHAETSKYARHFDFAIGLGSLGTGGSGLGILAEPKLAWLCGALTTASVVLATAKNHYDWHGRMAASMERISAYGSISTRYGHLVDDITFKKGWDTEFDSRYKSLRAEVANLPTFPYPHWDEGRLRQIQNTTKSAQKYRDYQNWWRP